VTVDVRALVKPEAGPGTLELRTVTLREPGPGEVRVRVKAAGICGTDLHILAGEWPLEPPVVVGHEMSGVVEELGPGVDETWLGARVVTEVFVGSDGTCTECRAGYRNLCPNRGSLGSKWDGAFAEQVVLPALTLHRIPDTISYRAAALLEPLACVTGALLDPVRVGAGQSVLVTGPGAVGLLAAQVARASGARVLLAGTERDRARLDVASALGIDTTTDADSVGVDAYDVVIECAGAAPAAELCLSAARRRGAYVQLGIFGKPVTVPLDLVCLKQLEFVSGFGALPGGMEIAIRLADQGLVDLEPLISSVTGLDEWQAQFDATRAGAGLKYLFAPSGDADD